MEAKMEVQVDAKRNSFAGYLERKIPIPDYTLGEELVNAISHGLGAGLGVAALCLCVRISYLHHSVSGMISSWIFGLSMIILYTMSCVYHSLKPNTAKRVMRIMDHCTIFLLIAGTYTPFTLISLRGKTGWLLFSIVWMVTVVGIVLNAIDLEKFKALSMVCYLAMGWSIIFQIKALMMAVGSGGIRLLVAGGIVYSVGAIIYGIGSKVKYMHSVWHFFVLGGSILHFLCIYCFVL